MSGEAFASPLFFKNFKMAHLITLTNSETNENMLFNLDTVVSIESDGRDSQLKRNGGKSIITTRWGRTMVKDTLAEIRKKSMEQTFFFPDTARHPEVYNTSSHPEYESQQDQYYSTKQ